MLSGFELYPRWVPLNTALRFFFSLHFASLCHGLTVNYQELGRKKQPLTARYLYEGQTLN